MARWLVLLLLATTALAQRCPPSAFDTISGFDVNAYASGSWFVQQQVPVQYQPPSELYCIKATYRLINPSNVSEGVNVYNYANRDKVNGEPQKGFEIIALPASLFPSWNPAPFNSDTAVSKFFVGPKSALPRLYQPGGLQAARSAFGPYWVVAVGPTNSALKYSWAIVTGGAPVYNTGAGCTTLNPVRPPASQYQGGLWLLTRTPVDPASANSAKIRAQALGLDVRGLVSVQQAGCTYEGSV